MFFGETPKTKIDFVENLFHVKILVFFNFFFLFFPALLSFYLLDALMKFTFPPEKIMKLKIEALFQIYLLCIQSTDTEQITHLILKSIHSLLRSESKTMCKLPTINECLNYLIYIYLVFTHRQVMYF